MNNKQHESAEVSRETDYNVLMVLQIRSKYQQDNNLVINLGAFHVNGMVQQLLVKLVSTMQDYPKTQQTAILHARGCKRVAEWGARVIQTWGYKRFHQPDFFADV